MSGAHEYWYDLAEAELEAKRGSARKIAPVVRLSKWKRKRPGVVCSKCGGRHFFSKPGKCTRRRRRQGRKRAA